MFSDFQFSQVNIDEPMFQPFPSEIFFQKFEPFETYEVPLVLRNNDKVCDLIIDEYFGRRTDKVCI